MFSPFSESRQLSIADASELLTPSDPASPCSPDLAASVLHETPANVRKKHTTTSRKRNGLIRRAPGSPSSATPLPRPTAGVLSANAIAGCAGTVRPEQHHPVRALLVHAEHEDLAADRADL